MADPKKPTEQWPNSRGNYPANTPYPYSANNQRSSANSADKHKDAGRDKSKDSKKAGKSQNEEDGQKKKSMFKGFFQNSKNDNPQPHSVINQPEFAGSYEDGGPTSLLLQRAATTVKHSLIQCADALYRFNRSHPQFEFHPIITTHQSNPPLNLHKSEHDHTASSSATATTASARKNKLRAFLSSLFFSESAFFPIPANLPRKRQIFQSYMDCKSSDERTEQNYEDMSLFADLGTTAAASDDFHRFLLSKMTSSNLQKNVNLMGDKDFRSSFVRLARRVWLLQKLVSSFALTPEIVRVRQGFPFNNDYMEDFGHRSDDEQDGQDDDDNRNTIAMNLSVAFMLVPGFVFRRNVNDVTIIKSQVICSHS